MGVIKRQSIKRTVVTYTGLVLGLVSTIFIYPLHLEIYGLAQFLISTSIFLVPFATLGIPSLVIRFFPVFTNPGKGHHGFLGFILSMMILSICLLGIVVVVVKGDFILMIGRLGFNQELFRNNIPVLLALMALAAFGSAIAAYASNFRRIVVPEILTNLTMKVGLPVLVLCSYYNIINKVEFTWFLVLIKAIILAGLFYYIYHLGQLKLRIRSSFYNSALLKKMGVFAMFGIIGSIGTVVAFQIDSIMVAGMIDTKNNGIYNIAVFIGSAIAIPFKSINAIASPLISSSWNDQNISKIDLIYKNSCLNLLIFGLFIFIVVWVSIDDLFRISSNYEELIKAKYVVLFLGIGKVIDMTTGINNQIIAYSKYFKFNLLAIILLGVVNITANLILIPRYQIVGAAMATAISLTLFNIFKFIFILLKFKLQPFTFNSIKVLGLSLVSFIAVSLVPDSDWPILNIAIRSILLGLIFIPPLIYFNISPDINSLYLQSLEKVKKAWRIFKK